MHLRSTWVVMLALGAQAIVAGNTTYTFGTSNNISFNARSVGAAGVLTSALPQPGMWVLTIAGAGAALFRGRRRRRRVAACRRVMQG